MSRRAERAAPSRPLRRRPKVLEHEPTLHDASAGAGGTVIQGQRDRRGSPAQGQARSGWSGSTDEEAESRDTGAGDNAADPETVRRAMEIARRLALPRPRRDLDERRGSGELASMRYRGGSDDIDIDRTLEQLVEHPVPDDEDIIVRERVRTRRSVVLLVDISGSMRGERIRTVSAAVGALAAELSRDDLAVIAFWSDAAVLNHLGAPISPQRLLDTMVRIPAQGLTNITFPLQVAGQQLARKPVRDARALLLSDCVHNAGPDPRNVAGRLPRLDVMLDTSGEHDVDLGRELARAGHGRLHPIRHHRDVPPALSQAFAE